MHDQQNVKKNKKYLKSYFFKLAPINKEQI